MQSGKQRTRTFLVRMIAPHKLVTLYRALLCFCSHIIWIALQQKNWESKSKSKEEIGSCFSTQLSVLAWHGLDLLNVINYATLFSAKSEKERKKERKQQEAWHGEATQGFDMHW